MATLPAPVFDLGVHQQSFQYPFGLPHSHTLVTALYNAGDSVSLDMVALEAWRRGGKAQCGDLGLSISTIEDPGRSWMIFA